MSEGALQRGAPKPFMKERRIEMTRYVPGLVIAAFLVVTTAVAQERQPLRPLQGVGAPPPAAAMSDQQIAALIYGACHNEVEVAKFAQDKLQSPEARAFAEKMIREHTPDCEAYARLA